ncbi:hypothetical protein FHW96_001054 [Novosphingobium sp. SG751A]|uniref:hypothetical protein n=1 Tax=Novosphingobium sp. SG751A TaxID=2587000 RepID=UPI00155497E1|nr:hypothetical protein [Novosphingobium sp. SG751A]NOW44908.1 hypothetical protein [Novosphingobium sp. SG751A]
MFALGCLALIVLPLLGFIAGLVMGGQGAGLWGAGIGLIAALLMSATAALALVKAGRKR